MQIYTVVEFFKCSFFCHFDSTSTSPWRISPKLCDSQQNNLDGKNSSAGKRKNMKFQVLGELSLSI